MKPTIKQASKLKKKNEKKISIYILRFLIEKERERDLINSIILFFSNIEKIT